MQHQFEKSFSVKNRNYTQEETQTQPKRQRHFTNQLYKSEKPNELKQQNKDIEKVAELMRLTELIKQELFKVKLCVQCKKKFSNIKSLIAHEEICEVITKKVKQQ